MTLATDLDALIAKAARIIAAQDPANRAALCRQEQRHLIQQAAYTGNAEQQAAMNAARVTGDAELIAIEAGLALQRADAALEAYDAVFGAAEKTQEGEERCWPA